MISCLEALTVQLRGRNALKVSGEQFKAPLHAKCKVTPLCLCWGRPLPGRLPPRTLYVLESPRDVVQSVPDFLHL